MSEMTETSVPLRTRIAFLAMCVGTFMSVLDTQIVASSLPDIAASLGATIQEASWIQTAYMIAEVIMIPLAGWLSRSLSLRRLYALASALFTLTSLLCALAWSIDALVWIRVFQGLCSGILAPLLYQGIYLLFPRERQASVTLYVVLIVSLAPIVGPTLGGWITQAWSWHWLFLLNLLPGICVTATVYTLLSSEGAQPELLKRFDFAGILLVALFLGPLEYVLSEGPDKDWFASGTIVCFTVVACLSLMLLVWRELGCRHPVIDLHAFRDRNFSTGCLFNFVMGVGMFGSGYLMTIFLSSIRGYNSQQIGLVMSVPGVAMLVSLPLMRFARARFDGRLCLAVGLAMFGGALWINAALTATAGFEHLFLPQVLRGTAIMLCLAPITALALGRLPVEAIPNATGLYSLMRSLGGGIGIAVANLLVEERYRLHRQRLIEALDPSRYADYLERLEAPIGSRLTDLDQAGLGGVRFLGGLVRRESLTMAYNDIWLLIAGLFGLMLLLLPVVRSANQR